ncbi:MAG: DNA adenine methylase [Desulfamplus sp.]|nr:DNA adenine methylase [Desulfamplus sp.]
MRFIGNKERLINNIYQVIKSKKILAKSVFDLFTGTTNVGKFFKRLDYQVFSSDLLYFSYVLQRAYIQNNNDCKFERLFKDIDSQTTSLFDTPLNLVIQFLNNLEPKEGFIYQNYTPNGTANLEIPRMYFNSENGKKIDSIRQQIETWKINNVITENEYFILLASLIETVPFYANISGVYAAFQKQWDPRAIKSLQLKPIEIIINNKVNYGYNENSVNLLDDIEADIFYLDPPYNQRQYAPNYHILETIAKYDNPEIKGISGLRNYQNQKSLFCNSETALTELYKIADRGKYSTLILSYNTEGIMPQQKIVSVLELFGKVELVEIDYLRFKSNSNGKSKYKKYIKEQLYILQK